MCTVLVLLMHHKHYKESLLRTIVDFIIRYNKNTFVAYDAAHVLEYLMALTTVRIFTFVRLVFTNLLNV